MPEIKIKCPTCGKVLRLAETPNIGSKTFTCPSCQTKHKVGDCPRYVPAQQAPAADRYNAERTQYAPPPPPAPQPNSGGEYTRIEGIAPRHQSGGEETITLVVYLTDTAGREYHLRLGHNTIGRRSAEPKSTVQIDTVDRTMSRYSADIDVRAAGGSIVCLFRNGRNQNPNFVNGVLVAPADQLILNSGDRIKMGETILTFKAVRR